MAAQRCVTSAVSAQTGFKAFQTAVLKKYFRTDHSSHHGFVVLHEGLLVLLGPLEQSVQHRFAQVGLHLLVQLGQDQLLRLCRAVDKLKNTLSR